MSSTCRRPPRSRSTPRSCPAKKWSWPGRLRVIPGRGERHVLRRGQRHAVTDDNGDFTYFTEAASLGTVWAAGVDSVQESTNTATATLRLPPRR